MRDSLPHSLAYTRLIPVRERHCLSVVCMYGRGRELKVCVYTCDVCIYKMYVQAHWAYSIFNGHVKRCLFEVIPGITVGTKHNKRLDNKFIFIL